MNYHTPEQSRSDLTFVGAIAGSLVAGATLGGFALAIGLSGVAAIAIAGLVVLTAAALSGLILRRALRARPDPSAAFDKMLSPRLYGFRAVSGSHVGGGIYRRVDLRREERVIRWALSTSKAWHSRSGYLTLTSERLIFVNSRLELGGSEKIDLSRVVSVDLTRRFGLSNPLLGIGQDALVVVTNDGKEHVFWPGLIHKEKFREEILDAAGLF